MAAVRDAVNLGLSARRGVNIKVRQPLGLCRIIVANPAVRMALDANAALLLEELNIKKVEFAENPEAYVSYEVKPNFKVLGPRFGARVKQIAGLLAKGDGAAFFAQLQENRAIALDLDGETVQLSEEEVDVRLQAREGFAAAQGQSMVVVLSTTITDELRQEGWAREFIRGVQDLRKEHNLPYDARIRIAVAVPDQTLRDALQRFEEAIAGEVLAVECVYENDGGADAREIDIEGMKAAVSIAVV